MKIDQQSSAQKNYLQVRNVISKAGRLIHRPVVIIGFVIVLMMVSLVSGVYLYKVGVLTKIKAIVNDTRIDAQASIQKELSPYVDNGLPKLYLDIPFDNYQQLSDQRDAALAAGVLISSDDDYVTGELHLENEASQAIELRLKATGRTISAGINGRSAFI